TLPQHSKTVAQVLPEIMQPADAALVAAFFCQLRKVAQRLSCRATCSRGGHAFGNILPDKLLEVERQFLVEFGVQMVFPEQRMNPVIPDAELSRSKHFRNPFPLFVPLK